RKGRRWSSTAVTHARQRAIVRNRARIRIAGIATVAAGITRAVIATCVAPTRTRVPPVAPARAARLAILGGGSRVGARPRGRGGARQLHERRGGGRRGGIKATHV